MPVHGCGSRHACLIPSHGSAVAGDLYTYILAVHVFHQQCLGSSHDTPSCVHTKARKEKPIMMLPLVKGVLAALVLLRVLYALLRPFFSPLRGIPGPPAARFTKLWYAARLARGDFQHDNIALHRRYGPLVRVGPNFVSFDDPAALKTVYGIASRFPKSDWYQGMRAPGRGHFTLFTDQDIRRHAETRKLYQHVYSMSSLVSYETFVDQCTDMFVDRLRDMAGQGRPVDMAYWFQAYAFDVIACITYGTRFGFLDRGEDIKGFMRSLHDLVRYSSLMGIYPRLHAWLFYPTARLGLFGSKGRVINMNFVQERLALRGEERKVRDPEADAKSHADGTPRDFLDRLWDKHDENPEKLTQFHIFLVGLANITAGSDTTASTLSGMLYLLLAHPRVLAKLQAEVRDFTASGRLSERPTFKEGQQMPYLDAVLKESLRLHSAVGLPLWRVVPAGGVHIAGHFIPEGTNIGLNAWVAHRNPEVWGRDADEFRPERWLEAQAEAEAGNRERLQRMEAYYLPFGLGARTCIGKHISILEILKLVPRLLREFEWALDRPEDGMKCEDFWFVLPQKFMVRVNNRPKQ